MSQPYKISEKDAFTTHKILEDCINQLQIALYLKKNGDDQSRDQKLWNFVINSLRITNEELKSNGSFTLLAKIIEQESERHKDDNVSVTTLNKYSNELSQLDKQIAETEASFGAEIQFKKKIIEHQTQEIENFKVRNESELEFEKKWLAVQVEENNLRCELEEASVKKEIENIEYDIEEEKKVHAEILWYYDEEKKKVNNLIAYWNDRFKDIEERKIKIENLYKKRDAQRIELDYYRTMFNKRKAEMEEYEADKEKRRLEYEYEQYRHKMATKIQAWWRGVMVRRGLGPFKKLLKAKDVRKRKMSLKKNIKK